MEEENPVLNSIDDYINSFPEHVRKPLAEIRDLIKKTVPEAEEKISYQIPTFYLNGNLVHFAGYDKYIGFYPGSSGIEKFKSELTAYKFSKGTVRFPVDKPLPSELIKRMVMFRVEENLGN